MINIYSKNSGIALVLVVGILSILAMVSVGFSAFSRLELQATQNYVNQFNAELIAEAGISRAIEELKYNAGGCRSDPYDTTSDAWYFQDGVKIELEAAANPSFGGVIPYGDGTYKLKVIDCASLININASLPNSTAEAEFESILSGLASQAGVTGPQATAFSQNLIPFRKTLPDGIFRSKEEIKLVTNIGQATYEKLKNFITLYGDADVGTGHTQKTFVNVNTAPVEVLWAVLRPMMGSDADCAALTTAIDNRRSANPFDGKGHDALVRDFLSARDEFYRFLEYEETNLGIDLTDVKTKTDPNTYNDPGKPKTDTTYFSFDSGGYYEIEALGRFQGASKNISKSVNIYHKLYYTTKDEFAAGTFIRSTNRDNVPVNISQCYSGYSYIDPSQTGDPNRAQLLYGAIKPGFWDDFSEFSFSNNVWIAVQGTMSISGGMLLTGPSWNYYPKIQLGNVSDLAWQWGDARIIMRIEDEQDGDYGRAGLPVATMPDGWGPPPAPYPPEPVDKDHTLQKYMNCGWLEFRIDWTPELAGVAYISNRQTESGWTYAYNIWKYFAPMSPDNLSEQLMMSSIATIAHLAMPSYFPDKTFHLLSVDTTAQLTAFWPGGGPSSTLNANLGAFLPSQGNIAMFGMYNWPSMDNVRIIPKQSYFTSASSDDVGTVDWGTISAGVRLSPGARVRPADGIEEVSVYLTTDTGAVADADAHPITDLGLTEIKASGGALPASGASTITYRVFLYINEPQLIQIPMLEDVTITYMPKTIVLSQSCN